MNEKEQRMYDKLLRTLKKKNDNEEVFIDRRDNDSFCGNIADNCKITVTDHCVDIWYNKTKIFETKDKRYCVVLLNEVKRNAELLKKQKEKARIVKLNSEIDNFLLDNILLIA